MPASDDMPYNLGMELSDSWPDRGLTHAAFIHRPPIYPRGRTTAFSGEDSRDSELSTGVHSQTLLVRLKMLSISPVSYPPIDASPIINRCLARACRSR